MESLKPAEKSQKDVYSSLTSVGSDPNVVAQLYTQLPRPKQSRRTKTVFIPCVTVTVVLLVSTLFLLLQFLIGLWQLKSEIETLEEFFDFAEEILNNPEFAPRTEKFKLESFSFGQLLNEEKPSNEEAFGVVKRKREIAAWHGPTSDRTVEGKESPTSMKSLSSEELSTEPSINFESSTPERGRKRRKGLRKPKKYHRHPVSAEKFYSDIESTTAVPIQIRQSRTKQTAGFEIGKHKRVLEHKPLLQVYGSKDYIRIEEALRKQGGSGNIRPEHVESENRHKFGNSSHIDHSTSRELAESVTYNMIMIHYAADTSHYSRERDSNYCGNGRMQMKESIYKDWKAAHSTQGVDISKYFSLDRGEVMVSVTGIYLIYAQVQYSNLQEVNGYEVIRNKQTVVQCITTSVHPDKHEIKSNTCDTSTTILLYSGDKIYIQDLHHGRHVVLKPEKSYFGLILLSPFKENNNLL